MSVVVFACALVSLGCSKSGGGGGSASTVAGSTSQTPAASTATSPPRNEYLEWQAEDQMAAADIVNLLNQTLGTASVTSGLPLRRGLYVTASPAGANTILRVSGDGGGVRPLAPYVEVAIPVDLGATFIQLAQTAMATASLTAMTPGLGQPWNLFLRAQSQTGGILEIGVSGDALGAFTLSWKGDSPNKPIDAFSAPTAFGPAGNPGATAKAGGTVHFPIDKDTFKQYVNRAYGYNAPQRFNDFALTPHTWLHLTVTADATGKVVNVHFDAVATSGARLYVAEAPASTDVGGRFFDETTARMQQMNDEEAAAPGSSKKWGTSFYYADVNKGVVDVVVKGEKGAFDIAYAVETPLFQVKP